MTAGLGDGRPRNFVWRKIAGQVDAIECTNPALPIKPVAAVDGPARRGIRGGDFLPRQLQDLRNLDVGLRRD